MNPYTQFNFVSTDEIKCTDSWDALVICNPQYIHHWCGHCQKIQ